MKILIVEDCEINALVVTGFLRKYNPAVEIDYAVNGKDGVSMAMRCDYDIIHMDINMPGMDGITATRHIKKNKPSQLIVAVTAVGMDHLEEKNALSTFDQILMKPLNHKLFIKTLDSMLIPADSQAYLE